MPSSTLKLEEVPWRNPKGFETIQSRLMRKRHVKGLIQTECAQTLRHLIVPSDSIHPKGPATGQLHVVETRCSLRQVQLRIRRCRIKVASIQRF